MVLLCTTLSRAHVHMHAHTNTHEYILLYSHIQIHTIHTHTYIYTHFHIHILSHTYTYSHIKNTLTPLCTHTHTHTHTHAHLYMLSGKDLQPAFFIIFHSILKTHMYLHIRTHKYTFIPISMHTTKHTLLCTPWQSSMGKQLARKPVRCSTGAPSPYCGTEEFQKAGNTSGSQMTPSQGRKFKGKGSY